MSAEVLPPTPLSVLLLAAVFSDLGASVQQLQCLGQLSFTNTMLLYMSAPLAAFLVVPPIIRVVFGITKLLGVYGAALTDKQMWDKAFFLASVVLFLIIAPTIGALARAQLW